MSVEVRRDLDRFPTDPRYMAAAAALQLYGGFDPDGSRTLARLVVDAVLRAGLRPTDGLPTGEEVARAQKAAGRRGIGLARDDAYAVLFGALVGHE
jgi:hypothetical protein